MEVIDLAMNYTHGKVGFETNTIENDEAIGCILIGFLIELIGNGLLILMIIYERYTMDPQKRTVINQLATQACYVFILQNLIGIPSATYVIIADDAGHEMSIFNLYFHSAITLYISQLVLAEILIFWCLYINYWTRMIAIDEDFIASFFMKVNVLVSMIPIAINISTEQFKVNYYYQASRKLFGIDGPLSSETYSKIKFWTITFPFLIFILLIISGGSIVVYQRLRNWFILRRSKPSILPLVSQDNSQEQNVVPKVQYNNQGKNPIIVNIKGMVICAFIFGICVLAFHIHEVFDFNYNYMLLYMPHVFPSIIIPSVYFLTHKNSFKQSLSELKDICFP